MADGAVVLRKTFERFPGQVDPVEQRIGRFEPREGAQRMTVMIEAAMFEHRRLQRILARMAEGRVADVVREAQRLGQIFIEAQRAGDAAPDLRDLDAVRQADAIMIAVGGDEHLRLVAQTAEGDRVDDTVAVALKGIARPAHDAARLIMPSPATVFGTAGAGGDTHLIGSTSWPASLLKRKPSPPAFL